MNRPLRLAAGRFFVPLAFCALLVHLPAVVAAPVTERPKAPLLKDYRRLPKPVAAKLRAEIAATPASASAIAVNVLRKHPKAAVAVVVEASRSLPLRNDLPDVPAIAALGRAVVETIYADLPGAREEVKGVLLALVEAVCVEGACPNPLFASQVLEAILPVVLKDDPAMANAVFRLITDWCPNCGVLLADLRARLMSPLTGRAIGTGRSTLLVEPNMVATQAPAPAPTPEPLPPATQFGVP